MPSRLQAPTVILWAATLTLGAAGGFALDLLHVPLAWLLGYPPIIIALFYRTARHCGIPIAELLRALYPSLVASAVMLAAVAGCRHIVPADVALPLRLALYILSGMLAYGLTLLLAFRSRVMTFVSFIRKGLAASAKPATQTVAPVHPSAPPG